MTNPESVAKYTDPYKTAQTKGTSDSDNTGYAGPRCAFYSWREPCNREHSVQSTFLEAELITNTMARPIILIKMYWLYMTTPSRECLKRYDRDCGYFKRMERQRTAALLSGVTKQPASVANYYGFHVATEDGYESLRAIAAFLADRYGGKSLVIRQSF